MLKSDTALTANIMELDTHIHRPAFIGFVIVLFGFIGTILWGSFAPLDSGINGSGSIIVAGERQSIQHLRGGIIESINVKEGEYVKAGQLLVQLNLADINADFGAIKSQLITSKAVEARLLAEQANLDKVTFSDSVLQDKSDAQVQEAKALQSSLFKARHGAQNNAIDTLTSNIKQLKDQQAALNVVLERYNSQISILNEQLTSLRPLSSEGYFPRNRLLSVEGQMVDIQTKLAQTQVDYSRLSQEQHLAELRLKQQKLDYQKDVESQLTDLQIKTKGLVDRFSALTYTKENAEIRAPKAGWIVNMKVNTVGGVIQAGQIILDIVPDNQKLTVKAQFPINSIDKLKPDLPVDIQLTSLHLARTPVLSGIVKVVSADQLTDERTGYPYLIAEIEFTPESLAIMQEKNITLRPGIPANAFVKTGQQSMATYIMKPLIDHLAPALTEP